MIEWSGLADTANLARRGFDGKLCPIGHRLVAQSLGIGILIELLADSGAEEPVPGGFLIRELYRPRDGHAWCQVVHLLDHIACRIITVNTKAGGLTLDAALDVFESSLRIGRVAG